MSEWESWERSGVTLERLLRLVGRLAVSKEANGARRHCMVIEYKATRGLSVSKLWPRHQEAD